MNNVLIVSHDPLIGKLFLSASEEHAIRVTVVSDLAAALITISKGQCDAVVVSVPLLTDPCPRKIYKDIQNVNEYLPVFFLMNQLNLSEAISLTKLGVEYCYSRPFAIEAVIENIQKTLRDLSIPVASPTMHLKRKKFLKALSRPAIQLDRQIELVADTNFKVIVYGETGTGKESVARRLTEGIYKDRPFVAVDCGCLSKELAASELFGHKKGSFSGAFEDKKGAFEEANNGTIFLDEIGNLEYTVQILLLRAIEEKKIRPVGSTNEIDIQVRIIVASNERLTDAVKRGSFREDLYYRLNEFEIEIPPLRNRMEDLEPFINFFIEEANADLGKNIEGVEPSLLDKFHSYEWPGNIRELKNVIRRGCLMTDTMITSACMSQEFKDKMASNALVQKKEGESKGDHTKDLKYKSIMAEYEEILKILKEENYSKVRTAERLNITRKTLYNKLNAARRLMQK
jgi:two-component system response regulator HydG